MKFPNLSKIKDIALDIETTDPDLKKLGPGARRPGSKILGVALSTKDKDFYFKADNKLYDYLADLKNKNFITARGLYDFDFLQYKGVNVSAQNSRIIDVQINAALLDDNRFKYNLDTLAKEALGVGKDERGLIKFCEDNELKGPPQTHLEKMPFELVSRYAKIDARRTFDLYTWQKPQIESQKLLDVFNLECDLLPLLLDMLRTGIRFDEKRRAELEAIYNERIEKAQKAIDKIAGRPVNVESNKQLQAVYDDLGFAYSFTEKGNPCFNAEALEGNPSILSEKVIHLRQVLKIQNTYIIGAKRFIINGRIHPLFHPLKNDNNGTVTGRFSSSLPNLQNQPSKNEVFKKEIRALYLPDKGQDFLRLDYSQIELRCLAHYAIGEGADEIRAIYTQKPDLDIHQACADMIEEERKIAKSINFGVVYGMGTDKLGRSLKIIRAKQPTKKEMTAYYKRGVTAGNETYFEQYKEARGVLDNYHNKLPFLKETQKEVERRAKIRGFIHSLSGRRYRLIDRNYGYKFLNKLLQGSAADEMKKAMVDSYKAGLFNVLTPHLTIHDELDSSMPRTKAGAEAAKELKNIFENTYKLRVPMIVEMEIGPNWGELKDYGN